MGLAIEQLKAQIATLSTAVATPASIAAVQAVVDADKLVDDLQATAAALTAATAPLATSLGLTAATSPLATSLALTAVKNVVDAGPTAVAVAAIPTTDHFAVFAETGPTALDAAGGAAPTATIDIPVGAKSFSIGSCNAALDAVLDGFCAPSDAGNTHSGEIATLSDAGFIPTHLDDDTTHPTHLYVENEDTVAGWVWIQWYE